MMITRLILSEAAYFYHCNKTLSSNFINGLFRLISRNRTGHYVSKIVNDNYRVNDVATVTYSLCVFREKSKPSFLDDEGNEEELKYGYLLIVQYSNMLVINKKNVGSIDRALSEYITEIDYITISRLFLSDRAYFEKFSMSNMDISDKAVRRRNVEAVDLKNSFSPIYASRYILNTMRIRDQDNRISLTLNTSRVNKLGKKVSFNDYLSWIVEVVDKITNFQLRETYLDNFSTPLNIQDELNRLTPTSVLFHFGDLIDQLDFGQVENVEYRYNEDKKRSINLQQLFNDLDTFCEIETNEIGNSGRFVHKIINPIDKSLRLKKNKNSLKVYSSKLQKIFIIFSNTEINLLEYINKIQSFIVTFSNIDIVYSNKKLFRDNKLLSNLDSFMEVLEEHPELEGITSEKGTTEPTDTAFPENSLFHFIDTSLVRDVEYLFCDDLGNEYADFISINNFTSICYYHAKHATSQMSASDFQVVIGQALKNIGNMNPTPAQLETKRIRWGQNYPNSNIPLKRRGDSVENGILNFTKTLNHPNSANHIYIVINYLSKAALLERLVTLKQGQPTRAEVVQLFWLLSSFISTCKELGFQAHITCKP